MATGRHFVRNIAAVFFFLACEYSNARPPTDSLYGDHVYSGKIIPISGAVPRKIRNSRPATDSLYANSYPATDSLYGNSDPATDSLYGDHVYSGKIIPISGAVPRKIHGHRKNHPDSDIPEGKTAEDAGVLLRDAVDADSHQQNSSNNTSTAAEEMKAQKAKKIFDMLGIDLSQIDLSKIDLKRKSDGKDSLQPSLCHDTYDDRYGVGKHFIRAARDVGFAIVSDVEGLIDNLLADIPLVPNITSGIGGGLKAVICALEDGFSDMGSDLDSVIDIAKNGLVNLLKMKGPHPVLDIPEGIGDIARETVKAAGQLVGDTVDGVKNAVGEIVGAL